MNLKKRLTSLGTAMALVLGMGASAFADTPMSAAEILQSDIDGASSGATIRLTDNVDITETGITIDKEITLDLDGKKITVANGSGSNILIERTGELTLIGDGVIESNEVILSGDVYGGRGAIDVYGDLIVDSATILANVSHETGYNANGIMVGWSGDENVATVTVNGGLVQANGSAITNHNSMYGDTKIIVNNGTVASNYANAIYSTFTATEAKNHDIEISGGLIYTEATLAAIKLLSSNYASDAGVTPELVITGGTIGTADFSSGIELSSYEIEYSPDDAQSDEELHELFKLAITGGEFYTAPDDSLIGSDYEIIGDVAPFTVQMTEAAFDATIDTAFGTALDYSINDDGEIVDGEGGLVEDVEAVKEIIYDAALAIAEFENTDLLNRLEDISKLDALIIAVNNNVDYAPAVPTYDASFDVSDDDDDSNDDDGSNDDSDDHAISTISTASNKLPEKEVEVVGLALAYFDAIPAETSPVELVELSVAVEQTEAGDGVDLAFTAKPQATTAGVTTNIGNDDIKAPITFALYLPETITSSSVELTHYFDGDDLNIVAEIATIDVLKDDNGDRYIPITVGEFSEFELSQVTESSGSSGSSGSSSRNFYFVKINTIGSGTVSPNGGSSGTVTVNKYNNKTFTFTPDDGYVVADVFVNDKSVGAADSYTIVSIKADTTLSVKFVAEGEDDNDDADAQIFGDVTASDWFYDSVMFVYENGLYNGVSDTEFAPNSPMTRAMLWTVLARYENIGTDGGATWYTVAREWAMENEISDGTNPEVNVTREQLVTTLYRYAQMKDIDTSKAENIERFDDSDLVSDYALDALYWAVAEGLVQGKTETTIDPQGNSTRAEVATIIMRFVDLDK